MGINNYITHRMFVAALTNEKDASKNDAQEQPGGKNGGEAPGRQQMELSISAVTEAKAARGNWGASLMAGGGI